MTDVKVAEFSQQIGDLSYDETISAIFMLLEKLKASSTNVTADTKMKRSVQTENIKKAFALADSLHLNSHGKKLAREELYER